MPRSVPGAGVQQSTHLPPRSWHLNGGDGWWSDKHTSKGCSGPGIRKGRHEIEQSEGIENYRRDCLPPKVVFDQRCGGSERGSADN